MTKEAAKKAAEKTLQKVLQAGWELDLFSTFLSRKSYPHKLVGSFKLFRFPRKE